MHHAAPRHRLCVILLVCAIAIGIPSEAQEFPEKAVKAELVVRFIEFVRWPNEAEKSSFSIGFFGADDGFYQYIQSATGDREFRGKTVTLSRTISLEQMPGHDIVVVSADRSNDLMPITLALRGSSTLIISDQSSDRTRAMINLILSAEGTAAFELNKANVLLQQLELSNEILLLGGTEMDVARLYREMEESLSSLTQERAAIEAQSASIRDELSQTRQQLRQSDEELARQRATIEEQAQLVADQLAAIDARQRQLDTVNESYDQTRALLEQQSVALSEGLAEVNRQQELVRENQQLIEDQGAQIARQQESIRSQGLTIHSQALLLYAAIAGLIVISALAIAIFWISRERKRLSERLEERGVLLEQMVDERTAELAESEQRYRALSELSPTAVFRTDLQGQCVYVNERWSEFSGLSTNRAYGIGWLDALHPDDRSRVEREWESAVKRDTRFASEFRFLTPDNHVTWTYAQASSEYDDQGQLVGYVGTATNISERKRLEEQLHQTQKMDALGQLTGGIAHDFNNLLAVIQGNLSLLEMTLGSKPDSEVADLTDFVAPALHATRRGAELTNRLLTFSRKKPVETSTVDVNQVIDGMSSLIERTLRDDIELRFELDASSALSDLDSAGFETSLLNLVSNSRDAMPSGGRLTIATSEVRVPGAANRLPEDVPPGSYLVVSVTDTGSGMDDETKERAIEPFFTTKDVGRGTGLGLSTVYGFAQQSAGQVLLRSAPGQGTTVDILLPKSAAATESTEEQPEPTDAAEDHSILVVEDDEQLRKVTVQMLERCGYRVRSAADGEEAMAAMAEDTEFDLLLTDVILPGGLNGPDVADAASRKSDSIEILYMSGYAKEYITDRVGSGERVNLLDKPFSYQTLARKVAEVLRGKE